MESVARFFHCIEDFGTETLGRTLYTNATSAYSREITKKIGNTSLSNEANCLIAGFGALVTGVFTTVSLGQIGFLPKSASCGDRLSIAAHFTVIPVMDGSLKVLYNLGAVIGNIARAALYLLSAVICCDSTGLKKFLASICYVGSNLVEIARNAIRMIPVVGHGLAKLATKISDIPIVGSLIEEIGKERLTFIIEAFSTATPFRHSLLSDQANKYCHLEHSCI